MSNYEEMSLEQIGAHAKAHVDTADKYEGKRDEHIKSAGLYLIEAKARVERTKGLTWPAWLLHNCPIGRSRADEIIMIADGRTTVEAVRAKKAESMAKTRAKRADPPPRGGKSSENPQQNQRPTSGTAAAEATPEAVVEEARATTDPRRVAIDEFSNRMRRFASALTNDELARLPTIAIEAFLKQQIGETQ